MKDSKASIKSQAIFSDDYQHRVFLRREWDKTKASALVVMINPSCSSLIHTDITTLCVLNNLESLDYGSVEIVNMYSKVTPKLTFRLNSDEDLIHPDTDKHILKAAENSQTVIIAWGTVGESNQRAKKREWDILNLLKPYSYKLQCISDGEGKNCIHPLCPSVRNEWNLIPFPYDEWMKDYEAEAKAENKDKAKITKKSKKKTCSKSHDPGSVSAGDTSDREIASNNNETAENVVRVTVDSPDTIPDDNEQERSTELKAVG